MKFGCCYSLNSIDTVAKSGYDYIEPKVVEIASYNVHELERVTKAVLDSGIRAETFCNFMPADIKLVGKKVNMKRIGEYVEEALRRVNLLGGKIVVFGSGDARWVPEGFSKSKAYKQLKEFLTFTADVASVYNLVVAIEAIEQAEANIVNTVEEATNLAKEINREEIKVLADSYAMKEEKENYQHLVEAKEYLVHVHVADNERTFPGSGNYDFSNFFNYLKKTNYNRRISVECIFRDFEKEGPEAVKFLKKIWTGCSGR